MLFQTEKSQADSESENASSVTAETIGAFLQNKRMSFNIGLDEVSEATGISTGVLKALETDDRENFPAEVYVKAFYRKYAQYLELDPDEVLTAYQPGSNEKKNSKSRFSLGTGITLKDRDESLFSEIAGWLYIPVIVTLCGAILYWIYVNYLAPY